MPLSLIERNPYEVIADLDDTHRRRPDQSPYFGVRDEEIVNTGSW